MHPMPPVFVIMAHNVWKKTVLVQDSSAFVFLAILVNAAKWTSTSVIPNHVRMGEDAKTVSKHSRVLVHEVSLERHARGEVRSALTLQVKYVSCRS